MWNKLPALMQDQSIKRLGVALCISLLVHFLLVGQFYLRLPISNPNLHTIEARILMPTAPKKRVEAPPLPKPLPKPVQKPEKKVKVPPKLAPKPQEPASAETPVLDPVESVAVTEPIPPDLMEPNNARPADVMPSDANNSPPLIDSLPVPADAPPQVDDSSAVNENAYQYVETTFNVSTKFGGSPEGTATMTYSLQDGNHYQINSVAKARGLAALVLSELVQTSEGTLTKTGLQPSKFSYNYGGKASKSRLATFDWQTKTVKMETAAGIATDDLPDGAQDLLSFMYQFMYVPPLHTMQIHIVNGKNLRSYDYSFEGEETTQLPIGETKTVHIQHANAETDEKIDLWLAVDNQYLPVKIVKIDKNGKIYEFTAANLKASQTTVHPANDY